MKIIWQSNASVWFNSAEKALPASLDELDEAIGEYINHLYQGDLYQHPMSFADLSVSTPSVVNHCRFQQGT